MPISPQKLYKAKVNAGLLHPDPVQDRAVGAFARLYDELMAAQDRKKSFWNKFGIFKKAAAQTPLGIYIYGDVGRGKSMLMDLFYESLPGDIKKRRVHFHAFMIEVHDYFHSRRSEDDFSEGVDDLLPSLAALIAARSMVLCFDEFHVTDVADAMILGRLFTILFERGVVVVATSNWPPDRLYEGGLQRDRFLPFIELLKSRMEIIYLDSPTDYRAKFLTQEGTYFWPLGDNTRDRLDEVFSKMTLQVPFHRDILQVKGRNIVVTRSAAGAARFSFNQLCENPHGAEDYLKIAQTYHTIFLENVPRLNYDRRNEAKRLMILIDALYETGTRLVMSADAPPAEIYMGADHGFEFQRTVSRLLEMQSEAYMSRQKQQ